MLQFLEVQEHMEVAIATEAQGNEPRRTRSEEVVGDEGAAVISSLGLQGQQTLLPRSQLCQLTRRSMEVNPITQDQQRW